MNDAYQRIIAASDEERRALFLGAATRIGTTAQNIEKDFWVCWTLDALFHRLDAGGPRLLFKGGTSLSKGYSLISRFSEDIDVTVFRSDIGEAAGINDLLALSGKQRDARLDALKKGCQRHITGPLRQQLEELAMRSMGAVGRNPSDLRIEIDADDEDGQSLLVRYPTVLEQIAYIAPAVKIESGAKSAVEPHEARTIVPYIGADLRDPNALIVPRVTTILPARTFLDKLLILHAMTPFFAAKGRLFGRGRVSRHFYDVHCLMGAEVCAAACADDAMIHDVVQHARTFFGRANIGHETAQRGSFQLVPADKRLIDLLRQDYDAMAPMIFGAIPKFDDVLDTVRDIEARLNAPAKKA